MTLSSPSPSLSDSTTWTSGDSRSDFHQIFLKLFSAPNVLNLYSQICETSFIFTRMRIWANKGHAEKNKVNFVKLFKFFKIAGFTHVCQVFMEEWLTDYRAKLMKKCKTLLKVSCLQHFPILAILTLNQIHASIVHINCRQPSYLITL